MLLFIFAFKDIWYIANTLEQSLCEANRNWVSLKHHKAGIIILEFALVSSVPKSLYISPTAVTKFYLISKVP